MTREGWRLSLRPAQLCQRLLYRSPLQPRGLFALNPFGRNAFDPDQEESHWKLAKGETITFRWRVVIHPGNAESGHVAERYRDYAAR